MSNQIGIVGGGAAGMMAAITAARAGARVTLFEHGQRIGKKILSTGNGKCNFTNLSLSKDDYYGNHPSFVASAFQYFDQYAAISFFEEAGMICTSMRDGYCYPFSGQASTVLNVMRMLLDSLGVIVHTECEITRMEKSKDNGEFFVFTADKKKYRFTKLILACGGKAAPSTGSDGSGYAFAKAFGHKVYKPLPALTYLTSRDKALIQVAGVRCRASISLISDKKVLQVEEGELQLNKNNLSGIPVFQLSHRGIQAIEKGCKVSLSVDLLKDFDKDETIALLQRLQKCYPQQTVEEAFTGLLNKKLVSMLLGRCQISHTLLIKKLTQAQMEQFTYLVHHVVFEIDGHGDFASAQVTMGGVDTSQISPYMMSELVDGLYMIGELLDVDGRCGGYNLQWAWTSGYIAGMHSASGEVRCLESHNVKLV